MRLTKYLNCGETEKESRFIIPMKMLFSMRLCLILRLKLEVTHVHGRGKVNSYFQQISLEVLFFSLGGAKILFRRKKKKIFNIFFNIVHICSSSSGTGENFLFR